MLYFKIWYEDKVIQGSSFEDWKNAPSEGVLIVYEKFEDGTGRISAGSDWYWMTPDLNVNQSGTSSEIKGEFLSHNAPSNAILKSGKWVSDEVYNQAASEVSVLINTI